MSAPRVLIAEGDLAEAQLLEDAIFEIPERQSARRHWYNARVLHAASAADAARRIRDGEIDLVLLNPDLADQKGIDSYRSIKAYAPDLPVILILGDEADEQLGHRALREGAQDFLWKRRTDWESLAHSMEAALERSRLVRALWTTFLYDPLTGMPNRSGFVYMAEMLRAVMVRGGKPARLLVAEVESVTNLGESRQEAEVIRAADAIRTCIDEGDLIGRTGPFQFCVLTQQLSLADLRARVGKLRPAGPRRLLFRWSELESQPEDPASLSALMAGMELPGRTAAIQ